MKLAEALILRADAQKRIQKLRERLGRSIKIQEGDAPPEDPQELLVELARTIAELNSLVKQINRTNAQTAFDDARSLTDALADRDTLSIERGAISDVVTIAASSQFRFGRAEIKYVSTVNVAELQQQADDLSRRHRELDSAIQALNWTVDLVE